MSVIKSPSDNLHVSSRSIFVLMFLVLLSQMMYTNIKQMVVSFDRHKTITNNSTAATANDFDGLNAADHSLSADIAAPIRFGGILFAEAGKKKKKEKSEVVVISVNNPSKGHGQMYPVFIPSCGGHGGYGRRKRSTII